MRLGVGQIMRTLAHLSRRTALAALAGAVFSGCGQTSGPANGGSGKMSVLMQTWIGYGYAVIAQKHGFFEELSVELSIVEDGVALADALRSGTADIIGSTLDQFVLQRSNGLPGKLLSLTDDSFGGDGMAVTTIRSLAEVRGKRVAYTSGPSSEYVLATALKSVGLTLDDITPVTFADPGGTVGAFVSGQVDAAVTFDPFLSQLLRRPNARYLFTTKDFPDVSIGCFVIREGIDDGEHVASAFIKGLVQAEEFAKANPEAADSAMASFWNLDKAALNAMRSGVRLKGREENVRLLSSTTGREPIVLERLRDIHAHYKSRGATGPRAMVLEDIEASAVRAFAPA